MKRVFLVCVVCACTSAKLVSVPMLESAPVAPVSTVPDDETVAQPEDQTNLAGTWEGRAYQRGNTYPVSVTFERQRGTDVAAHVYYSDQRCRADWKLHSSEPRHWQGEESVTTDPFRRCPDHGRVTVEVIDEETMNWQWTRGSDTVRATLERKGH
jgi:hypothetical protein